MFYKDINNNNNRFNLPPVPVPLMGPRRLIPFIGKLYLRENPIASHTGEATTFRCRGAGDSPSTWLKVCILSLLTALRGQSHTTPSSFALQPLILPVL